MGLPASLHSVHETIDISFSSSNSWSNQFLKSFYDTVEPSYRSWTVMFTTLS